MRAAAAVLLCVAVTVVVAGCGQDEHVAREARAKTLSAPHLVLSQPGGREVLVSRDIVVLKRRGRVLSWTGRGVEFLRRGGRGCFDRSTSFNRSDLRDVRRSAWPREVALDDLDVDERAGVRVLRGTTSSFDSGDAEVELVLDGHGRLAVSRQRTGRFGAIPATSWRTTRYRYLSGREFDRQAGPPPQPRCA